MDTRNVPSEFAWEKPSEQRAYLIDGELRYWKGELQEVVSPLAAAGVGPAVLGGYPKLSAQEAEQAIDAAMRAFDGGLGRWPMLEASDRIERVAFFSEQLRSAREQIVRRMMWEIGKSLPEARREVDRTLEYIDQSLTALVTLEREATCEIVHDGFKARVRRTPRGIVLCMGPFNYPLNETLTTVIPALLMGNSVILKLPKLGVLLLEPVINAFAHVFPPGVINVLSGDGRELVTPLIDSGKLDVFAFIGSTDVARTLLRRHPHPHRMVNILGLGTKNPAIVTRSANLNCAVSEIVRGSLSFNGQRCTALSIVYVARDIAGAFLDSMAAAVDALTVGLPWEEGATLTPCAEPDKLERLQSLLKDAEAHGARVVNELGGKVERGVFRPAILFPVEPTMKLFHEEQFGPLVPVVPFDSIDEVLFHMRRSPFSQQVSIFSADSKLLDEMTKPLSRLVCRININTQCQRGPDALPFTGRKGSGLGTLSIIDALKAFSIESVVAARVS